MNYPMFLRQLNAAKDLLGIRHAEMISQVDSSLEILGSQLLSAYGEPWLHLDRQVYSPHFLYVGLVSQLPLQAEYAPRHCVCIIDAMLPASYHTAALKTNLILLDMGAEDGDMLRLLNHTAFILADDIRFLRGFNWIAEAQEKQLRPADAIQLVEELLGNPVLLMGMDGIVYAKGQQYEFDHALLQQNIEQNRIQPETLASIEFCEPWRLSEGGKLAEMQYAGWRGGFLSVEISHCEMEIARLIIQNRVSPYYESSIQLLQPIRRLLGVSLGQQMAAGHNRSLLHSLLFQELLSGKTTQELAQQIENLHWKQTLNMRLLCCIPGKGSVETTKARLQAELTGCRWTTDGNSLLFLLYAGDPEETMLQELLRQCDLRGGLSWPFNRLEDMPYAHQQAKAALQYGRDVLTAYREIFPAHVMTLPVEQLRHFVHPAVLQLEEYDREHDGTMLQTLDAVLCAPDQMQKVAERLFVHRNTLFYRINRMRELCHIDFANGEERVNLLLSLRLLQGHGLINM